MIVCKPTGNDYLKQSVSISRGKYTYNLQKRKLLHTILSNIQLQYYVYINNIGIEKKYEKVKDMLVKDIDIKKEKKIIEKLYIKNVDEETIENFYKEIKEIKIYVNDIIKMLKINKSGKNYIDIKKMCYEIYYEEFYVEDNNKLQLTHVFDQITYDKIENSFRFVISRSIIPYITIVKNMYTEIDMRTLNKFKTIYALRIYEIIMSYAGFAGKENNEKDTWYIDIEYEKLRLLLSIPKDSYEKLYDFKRYVIDQSIKLINNIDIGIKVKADYKIMKILKNKEKLRIIAKYNKEEKYKINKEEEKEYIQEENIDREYETLKEKYRDIYEECIKEVEIMYQNLPENKRVLLRSENIKNIMKKQEIKKIFYEKLKKLIY